MPWYLFILGSIVTLSACSVSGHTHSESPFPKEHIANTQPILSTLRISERGLRQHIAELAHDRYAGRAPGTQPGEKAADWIAQTMENAGLQPAVNGSWFQPVSMVGHTLNTNTSHLTFTSHNETKKLQVRPGKNAVFWTKRQTTQPVLVNDSELVFVGYGIVAPEYGWNDYKGLDVKGKTVVMLVNDPGFATGNPNLFNGKTMTYYGRWTYKFEQAAMQGAAAALIIHETNAASYPWSVVTGSWAGEQADLNWVDKNASRTAVEGWINRNLAYTLFSYAGLDMQYLYQSAAKPGFKPITLSDVKMSATVIQNLRYDQSRNVAGMIKGSLHPDEYILYTAHWDHLGDGANGPDNIFNGAVDNATGVAMMLQIAAAFARGKTPTRSVMFLAVTLEESGLLGSAYFAQDPFVPLNKIVAGINIDGVLPLGSANDMIVVGSGASQLEDLLEDILDSRGRTLSPDPQPEAGYFYRSDHFSLARKGVPMLYADGGLNLKDGGLQKGLLLANQYRQKHYHQPSDEYSDNWNVDGIVEDTRILYRLGLRLANSRQWPNWYPNNEFRAIRDASRQQDKIRE